jgi:hypothetical protein
MFTVHVARPAWVFWWDQNDQPQNALHIDTPLSEASLPGQLPWADSNVTGARVTVAPGAYPLRVMVLEPVVARSDNVRVQAFLKEALGKPLSVDQVEQVLEIARACGSLDPQVCEATI